MSLFGKGQKNRTVVLHAGDSISWMSCVSISRNLKAAYSLALKNPLFIPYTDAEGAAGNIRVAKLIAELQPQNLVFLDHTPHPVGCLHALKAVSGAQKLPALSFHVYGDFNICSRAWLGVEKILGPNHQARFICASEKQRDYVSQFLKAGASERNLELLPFPIATDKFKHVASARGKVRKKLGIANDAFIFLYVGRLSMQKNILLMIESFQAIASKDRNVRLLLLGSEDDIGSPLHGVGSDFGSYGQAVRETVQALPLDVRKRIYCLGAVASEQLPEFYSASDVFFSLSLHHDEDYGMAPAEALCCGLPTCLTDWGGFSGHAQAAEDGLLIPVTHDQAGLSINKSALRAQMLRCLDFRSDHRTKQNRSARYRARYSIRRCANSLQKIASHPAARFAGFSSRMTELSFLNTVHDGAPFRENDLATRQFYARTYAHYFKKTELR